MAEGETEGRDKLAVAARLRLTRDALGMKQGEFALAAGIKKNTYNQFEQGKNLISLEEAYKLVDAHQLTLDWIYLGDLSNLKSKLADAIRAIRKVRR